MKDGLPGFETQLPIAVCHRDLVQVGEQGESGSIGLTEAVQIVLLVLIIH